MCRILALLATVPDGTAGQDVGCGGGTRGWAERGMVQVMSRACSWGLRRGGGIGQMNGNGPN